MRAHEENRSSADRKPASVPPRPAAPLPPLLALQRAAGNAAVTRAIEEARHEHGPDCGHGAAAVQRRAEAQPSVQRRSSVFDAVSSPHSPLEPRIQQKAEQAYGMSFAHVRVHSGPVAQRSAQELDARAYTTGSDIVVGPQGVDDETMFHEIDHVHQQSTGPVAGTDNGAGAKVSHRDDPFERRSAANGRKLAQGGAPDLAAP
ncbi:eCIS core domain-containing protein [Streptomyces avermitilis]